MSEENEVKDVIGIHLAHVADLLPSQIRAMLLRIFVMYAFGKLMLLFNLKSSLAMRIMDCSYVICYDSKKKEHLCKIQAL